MLALWMRRIRCKVEDGDLYFTMAFVVSEKNIVKKSNQDLGVIFDHLA